MTEPASVSRRINAPADVIFAILADPARHPEIDGSGMLRVPDGEQGTLSKTGDIFVMRMHNDRIGDYVMANFIVEYEPVRRIVWEPEMVRASSPEGQSRVGVRGGHRWGYELTPDGEATVVTEIADFSNALEWLREVSKNGEVWIPAMTASLENLDRLATRS